MGESMGGRQTGTGNNQQGGPSQGVKLKGATDGRQITDHQGAGGRNLEGT